MDSKNYKIVFLFNDFSAGMLDVSSKKLLYLSNFEKNKTFEIPFYSKTVSVNDYTFIELKLCGNYLFASACYDAAYDSNYQMTIPNLINSYCIDLADGKLLWKEMTGSTNSKEYEVIQLLTGGFNSREIGIKLDISSNTVNNHIQKIYKKTGVNNRIKLLSAFFNEYQTDFKFKYLIKFLLKYS